MNIKRPAPSRSPAPAGHAERPRTKGARLSIGALSRATGVPVETLRTWESRYGFPVPERRPSGHRVYPLAVVPRLRRIAEALARGHRAGQVVPASEGDLQRLLAASTTAMPAAAPEPPAAAGSELPQLLSLVGRFEADRLTHALFSASARLGPLPFLETIVAPLLTAVGEAWAEDRLQVRHEHFLSERLGDVLRSLRLPLEEQARGPLAVLSTLPGEAHGLGLQMAALVLAHAGWRVLHLGTETPLADMAALARDLGARALALSLSQSSRGPRSTALVRRLREMLPRRMTLVVGGAGAPPPGPGLQRFDDLARLSRWARDVDRI